MENPLINLKNSMLYSIIYVGREVLEMVFLTYLIAGALKINIPTIISAILGLISGFVGGFFLAEILEPFEWASYGVLSIMMIYLFFNTVNIKKHIDMHVQQAKNGIGIFAGIGAIYIIYLRESMEINTFLFLNTGDPLSQKIIGAGIAAIIVVSGTPILMKYKLIQKNMFSITRYSFLLFGILFGYEAIEHII